MATTIWRHATKCSLLVVHSSDHPSDLWDDFNAHFNSAKVAMNVAVLRMRLWMDGTERIHMSTEFILVL